MNAREDGLANFLGFAVGVKRDSVDEIKWLNGFKCFESVEPDPDRAQRFSTLEHPIQDFRWGHYWADPDTEYHYVVRPLFRPDNEDLSQLRAGTDLEISVRTESESTGQHSVLFNRGAIVSQAYAERFNNDQGLSNEALKQELNNPDSVRTKWLSRGLLEGLLGSVSYTHLTLPTILRV